MKVQLIILILTITLVIIYYWKNYDNMIFDKKGYLIKKSVLSKNECDELWKDISFKWRKGTLEAVRENILTNVGQRRDIIMDFSGINRKILIKVFLKYKKFIEKHFGTKNIGLLASRQKLYKTI